MSTTYINLDDAKQAIRERFKDPQTRAEINAVLNGLPAICCEPPKSTLCSEKRYSYACVGCAMWRSCPYD